MKSKEYTDEQLSNIANNLNFFRKYYKEKQSDLADLLEITEGTISEYINKKRVLTKEHLTKLAKHYNITIDEFVNKDYSCGGTISFNLTDVMQKGIIDSLTPLIEENSNNEDYLFKEAAELYVKIKGNINSSVDDLEKVFKLFCDSFDKYNNCDSLANILFILLEKTCGEHNPEFKEFLEVFAYKKINTENIDFFIKNSNLLNYFDDESEESLDGIDRDSNKYDIYINAILNILKQKKEYKDFVDYFNAIRYALGIGDLKKSIEDNKKIGEKMFKKLFDEGNKYVLNYFEYFYDELIVK